MSKLQAPLKPLMDDSLDAARVQRMWRRLERAPSRRRVPARLALGTLALSVVAALAMMRWSEAGPLAALGGGALRLDQPHVTLSDGSHIGVAADSELQLLENDGRDFGLALTRGRAQFVVTPGGPRRWRIECGLVSVQVVGTEFTIDREPSSVRVEVRHGIVEVRGARVEGGVQRLRAGQTIQVADTPEPAHLQPTAARDTPAERSPAQRLEEADSARASGESTRALALWQALLRDRPGTSEAAIAAFSLARMQMQAQPDAAAAALRASLAADVPSSLREDIMARLVEAYARGGHPELARQAADDYRRRYPEGRRAAEVEHWAAWPKEP
jgi:transmembrane sensor